MPSGYDSVELPGTAQGAASHLSLPRLELAAWIRRYAPSLADLYQAAVLLLYGAAVPGRVVLVCHAVREICNRLPGRVSGTATDGRCTRYLLAVHDDRTSYS